ncbi:MAG TPA: hypothetical protein V6C63_16160 [Allocoleopsis sp.]
MRLIYTKPHNLNRLHQELIAEVPSLAPENGKARLIIEGDGHTVVLTVPDESDQAAIAAVVNAHSSEPDYLPDWALFYTQFEGSAVELKILTSANQAAVMKLSIEFGKRPHLNVQRLQNYWNLAIASVTLLPNEIAQLNEWANLAYLPIRLSQVGQMIRKDADS